MLKILNNDIIVNDKRYEGSDGLWELLTQLKPYQNLITDEDINNYREILLNTNVLYDNKGRVKGNKRGVKWDNYLKPIIQGITGEGIEVKQSQEEAKRIIIPCNPVELIERMDLLIASKDAGNTGVDEELEMIFKTSYDKKVINKTELRKLYTHIS